MTRKDLRKLFNQEEKSFIDKAHSIGFSTSKVRDHAIDSRFATWVRCAKALGVLS